MKKTQRNEEPEIRPEYDFRSGIRGKYLDRFGGGRSVVVLEPDVAEVFTDSDAVNEALRALIVERRGGQAGE